MSFNVIDIGNIGKFKSFVLSEIVYSNSRVLNIHLEIVNIENYHFNVFVIFQNPFTFRTSDESNALKLGKSLENLPKHSVLVELCNEPELLSWARSQFSFLGQENKCFLVFTESEFIEVVSSEPPTVVVLPA